MSINTILFDLDGTLADTASDLATALNLLRAEEGHTDIDHSIIRPYASHGTPAMLKLGFNLTADMPGYDDMRERFLDLYANNLCNSTTLFPGTDQLLADLTTRGLRWGVVTNKPGALTEPLLEALNIAAQAACIVSGDTTAHRKPHPEPILHACRLIDADKNKTIYVGDAERDIKAGKEAGIRTLVALFGYIHDHEQPHDWGADGFINTPLELLDWLDAQH